MKRFFLIIFFGFICAKLFAQVKVYPSNWWTGMKTNSIQLMFHGNHIGNGTITTKYPGIVIKKSYKAENPNYLFLDIVISLATKPGVAAFQLTSLGNITNVLFPIEK